MVMIPDDRDLRVRLIEAILKKTDGSWLAFKGFITRKNEVTAHRKVETDGNSGCVDSTKTISSVNVRRDSIEVSLELRKPFSEKVHNFSEPRANLRENDQFETEFGLAIVTHSEVEAGSYWYLTVEIGLSEPYWGSPIATEESE
ncbi:MAG: hypothetical protein KDM91_08000 [Verrucomicrobiae bacterium]|nr:hypothetical protein [Verrucomicrobiae bacterium]